MCSARVVVTGFGPFADIVENSSTVAALNLKYKWENVQADIPNPTELIVVPNVEVSYVSANKVVCEIWNEIKPDLVVHVGVASGSTEIAIETQATYSFYIDDEECLCQEPSGKSICTNLKLEEVCSQMQALGFTCRLSNYPGSYVCAYTYYCSLEMNPCRSVFIHVPMLSDKFTADYLGDFLLSLIVILCKQCDIPVSAALESYFRSIATTTG
ncbi:hypothetical protein Aperf_G00000091958 [Anoplocephala perfoliata]